MKQCVDCGKTLHRASSSRSLCWICSHARQTLWTPGLLAELRERLWQHGESVREAAMAMGKTKNAVIGAMHRHGIEHPNAKRTREPRGPYPYEVRAPGSCLYPIGDPKHADFRFCGSAAPEGVYCAEHRAICLTTPPDAR